MGEGVRGKGRLERERDMLSAGIYQSLKIFEHLCKKTCRSHCFRLAPTWCKGSKRGTLSPTVVRRLPYFLKSILFFTGDDFASCLKFRSSSIGGKFPGGHFPFGMVVLSFQRS